MPCLSGRLRQVLLYNDEVETYRDWFVIKHPDDVSFWFSNNHTGELGLFTIFHCKMIKLPEEFRQHSTVKLVFNYCQSSRTCSLSERISVDENVINNKSK